MTMQLNAPPRRIVAFLTRGGSPPLAIEGLTEPATLEIGNDAGVILTLPNQIDGEISYWPVNEHLDELLDAGARFARVLVDGVNRYAGPVLPSDGRNGEAGPYQIMIRHVPGQRGAAGRGIETIARGEGNTAVITYSDGTEQVLELPVGVTHEELTTALANKLDADALFGYVADEDLDAVVVAMQEALGTKADAEHRHDASQIDNLPETYDDAELRGIVNSKADAEHRHDASEIDNLPDLSGFATTTYVDDAINAIEIPELPDLSGFLTADDLPDLSGFATTTYVDDAINGIEIPEPYDDAPLAGRVTELEQARPPIARVVCEGTLDVPRPDAEWVEWVCEHTPAHEPTNAADWDDFKGVS